MMTPRTTVTPPVTVPPVEKKAMYAATMAANREIRRQRVQAKIDQNRKRYDALTEQEKIEFWMRGDFALNSKKNLPADNSKFKIAGAVNRGKCKKNAVPFDDIEKAAKAWGQKYFTVNAIYHLLKPRRDSKAIRRDLETYVCEGKLAADWRISKRVYTLAVQS